MVHRAIEAEIDHGGQAIYRRLVISSLSSQIFMCLISLSVVADCLITLDCMLLEVGSISRIKFDKEDFV